MSSNNDTEQGNNDWNWAGLDIQISESAEG